MLQLTYKVVMLFAEHIYQGGELHGFYHDMLH